MIPALRSSRAPGRVAPRPRSLMPLKEGFMRRAQPLSILAILLSACLSLSAGVGLAQEVSKEVLEAAKREGKVTVYGSPETEIMKAVQNAFQARYRVKVEYWRASSTKVLDRALTEHRAGKPLFDVALTNETP